MFAKGVYIVLLFIIISTSFFFIFHDLQVENTKLPEDTLQGTIKLDQVKGTVTSISFQFEIVDEMVVADKKVDFLVSVGV